MKIEKKILIVLAIVSLSINACKKEYEDIGLPASKIEGVTSKWVLSTFKITDKGGILDEQMDMTDYYTGNSSMPNITFVINGADTTFSCDTAGVILNLFKAANGRWRFDNNDYPTKIMLLADDKSAVTEFSLLAPIRKFDNTLSVSQATKCGENTVYTYDLVLNRVSN